MARKRKAVVNESSEEEKKSKKVKAKATPKPTYHKSKNNRYYKKLTVDGKCKTRFCSKKEAEDNGFS
jgi:hypothetical protein